jgi:hypothetical protein
MSIEEILRGFPHLTPAQVYDAFSYYYDNQVEIEKDISENEEDYIRGLNNKTGKFKHADPNLKGLEG